MIRQLQNAGPTVKIILGALLVLICASMAITLIPGGIGSSFGIGAPPAGVLATIGDQTVTVPEVQREARAMIRQQFPRGGAAGQHAAALFCQSGRRATHQREGSGCRGAPHGAARQRRRTSRRTAARAAWPHALSRRQVRRAGGVRGFRPAQRPDGPAV